MLTSTKSSSVWSSHPPSIPAAAFLTLASRSPRPFWTTNSRWAIVNIRLSGNAWAESDPWNTVFRKTGSVSRVLARIWGSVAGVLGRL